MKYSNPEKTAVITQHPRTGEEWTVPRGQRFWREWGIDTAEQEGRIGEPETMDITGDADGGATAS